MRREDVKKCGDVWNALKYVNKIKAKEKSKKMLNVRKERKGNRRKGGV